MSKVIVCCEIGINHNGNINIAKKLIDGAIFAGCDCVKFQKRNVDTVYTAEELDTPRKSPWGTTTRQQKEGLEFGREEYDEIDRYCKESGIPWFASAWDLGSQEFLKKYDCKYNKIASAMLTHIDLLNMVAKEGKHTFISTGMSTLDEINKAVTIFRTYDCPFELMHCVGTYPMRNEDANLNMINTLQNVFKCNVGWSDHSVGIILSTAAVAIGATSVERHITLARESYGSDQPASMEIPGMYKMVNYIRAIEKAMGDGEKRIIDGEKIVKNKLRYFEKRQ